MTGSIPDPRVPLLALQFSVHVDDWSVCERNAVRLLERLDAADEASGVRRVTAQEAGLAREWRVVWKRREPGQIERATSEETALALAEQLSHIVGPTVRVEYRDVGEWTLHASSAPPAADSPVGGVS